ncbi:hypothetical protein OAY12_06090 [Candidatus Pelagibacter sp.]|nr:hypothetical protein [Candidatus Pelagibacter sp.]
MINFISNYKDKIILVISIFLLFVSFYYNEDGTGGGAKGDFEVTYGFILALQENLLADPKDWTLVHTPLHFIILSFVTRLISNTDLLRLLFCIFSLSLPLLFFYSLLISKIENVLRSNVLILSTIILFIPSFRYTSIWANNLITSLFFFILSIYFFKKWEKNKKNFIDKNSLYQIIFLVLATYTRQYYAVFFLYFLFRYFLIFDFKEFMKIFLLCVLSSLPVLYYTYLFPELLTGQHISLKAINYFLLGNLSIMSITVFPIIMINIIYGKIQLKKTILPILISFLTILILSLNFEPVSWQGGGVNFMISQKLFNNQIYFYFTSFITLCSFIYIFIEKKENFIILIILTFMFFSMQVYQRYYEPMFFIIFFTLIKTNLINIFLKKFSASLYLLFYFVGYYIITISDYVYKI